MDYNTYRKNRLRSEERFGVMRMDMLAQSLDTALRDLQKRLVGFENLDERVDAAFSLFKDLTAYVLKDQPKDTAAHILRQSRDFVITFERRSPVKKGEEIVVPIEDIFVILSIALDSQCAMCFKSASESAQCRLRALLRRYTDEPDPGFSPCGYIGGKIGTDNRVNKQKPL